MEIYDITGKAKSEQKDVRVPRFAFSSVSIEYPREVLYQRINQRVDEMFAGGLIDEVQSLLNNGVTMEMQCMQGIGYKEVAEGLQKGWTEEEMRLLIQKNTRNYAKRQQTFFKRMENHVFLEKTQATAENVIQILNN